MNRTIRYLTLGLMAVTCGFGSVYLIFTYITAPMSAAVAPSASQSTVALSPIEPRHYVINLTSSAEPIKMATVQHPDAFARYQIYTSQLTVNDTIWHQLRLGFFADATSAEKIAAVIRKDYPHARIMPVSPREWSERANAALVALVATELSTPTIKSDAARPESKQPKPSLARAPSAVSVALSSSAPAHVTTSPAEDGTPTECDTYAAHPWDPWKLTEGVYWNQVPAAKAVLACRKAVRNEANARNMFQYARALAKSQEFVEAVQWYKKSASQGYVQAQYALGDVYEFGEGVEVNYVMAQSWYRKAADQGYSHASSKLDRLRNATITNTRQQMATADTGTVSTQ